MKKLLLIILMVGLIVGGFYVLNNYIYNQKQIPSPEEPYEATLTGKFACLPHKDTSGPQTLECAYGIQTEDGSYYALDLNQLPEEESELTIETGKKFRAEGIITPVKRLSSDNLLKYKIEGVFTVTGAVQEL